MKKTLFVAFLACITMMFVSCKKEKTLIGTNWKAQVVTTEDWGDEEEEATITITINGTLTTTLDFTLKFIDASKASMTLTTSATATMGGQTMPMPGMNESFTTDLTYTFDGEKGTLTGVDEETGKPETIPFTYNKKDNTIKISQTVVEEDGEPFTIEMVFNEVK